ncbi:hypothetical protein H6P81_003728 [Aristolochia fimbriata]|uniref:Pentatricopeptide repeat-containing protein n=1 Tax=Aristolochia fimbriata TaxID=158543 RepID=A0AAV7FGB9_ARIFI|nr:hypothetical protein H6P81_003728 [Aristolochia fimbriata]
MPRHTDKKETGFNLVKPRNPSGITEGSEVAEKMRFSSVTMARPRCFRLCGWKENSLKSAGGSANRNSFQCPELVVNESTSYHSPPLSHSLSDPAQANSRPYPRLLNFSFVDYARKVFDGMPRPDQNLYNSLISGYSRLCMHEEVIETFFLMHRNEISIAFFNFPPVIKSCASLVAIREGKQLHSTVIRYGLDTNLFIQTAFIDLYGKPGDLEAARRIFDGIVVKDPISYNCLISGYSKGGLVLEARQLFDRMPERTIVSWNSMISCYAHNGDPMEGFRLFERMQTENFQPNEITLVTVLSMCAKLGDLAKGLKVKQLIDENNLCRSLIVSTAILEMYVKCGAVDEARNEFDKMPQRDIVAWSAMIAGYAQNGRSEEAIELFEQMKFRNFKPNEVTLVSVLSACAQLGSVETGERIGSYVENEKLVSSAYVGSALLDVYAKCGNVKKARQVFDQMPEKDVVSWNAIIGGLAFNGLHREAINLFVKMKELNVKPNEITFVGLLTACTHAGLVELGYEFFESMKSDFNINPKVEHCACIVDLLCRLGRLEEAHEFISFKMEVEPNVVIWGILLSACRTHSNMELAEVAIKKLTILEPENSGNYVLLANLYSSLGRWEEALEVRKLMQNRNVQKTAANSWIELDNMMHAFLVRDTSHPRSDEINSVVEGLGLLVKWAGCTPSADSEI